MTEHKTLNEYQVEAHSFRLTSAQDPFYPILGLSGEVGELLSLYAKGIRDGWKYQHQMDVKKELGDILWMVSQIAIDNGFTLGDVAQTNIEKLKDRQLRDVIKGSGDDR